MPRLGRGRYRGRRLGRMGGAAAGPEGLCICTNPDCGYTVKHDRGVPCYKIKCQKCASPMVRK